MFGILIEVAKKIYQHAANFIQFSFSSRFTLILTLEILLSVILGMFSLLLFFKLGDDVFQKEVFALDSTITNFIYGFRSPVLNKIMLNISIFGNVAFLFCLSVITVFYLYTKRKKDALIFSSILYTGVIINLILKEFFHRPRPHLFTLIAENSYSFPSGHAMNSFVFYTAIAYFILRASNNITLAFVTSGIAIIIIVLIGISRIYLGAHYPSDVIAGYVGGFFWFISAILFEKTIIFERLYRSANKQA